MRDNREIVEASVTLLPSDERWSIIPLSFLLWMLQWLNNIRYRDLTELKCNRSAVREREPWWYAYFAAYLAETFIRKKTGRRREAEENIRASTVYKEEANYCIVNSRKIRQTQIFLHKQWELLLQASSIVVAMALSIRKNETMAWFLLSQSFIYLFMQFLHQSHTVNHSLQDTLPLYRGQSQIRMTL